IIGRIAKVQEIEQFMRDPPDNRRALLIERLLRSPEYSTNWANMWTNWLMTRTGQGLYRDQLRLWLDEQFAARDPKIQVSVSAGNYKDMVEKLLTATGKTNDNGAVNYILAHLGESQAGNQRKGMRRQDPAKTIEEKGQFDMVPVTSRTIRVFLGYQVQ